MSTISLALKQDVEHLVGSPMDADAAPTELEWRVLEVLKVSEERGDPPLVRVIEVGRCIGVTGGPSTEFGHVLVSLLCFRNNTPSLWKLLDQAINARLLSPLHILALLTSRVIPHRRLQPEAYRLYLELLGRYGVSLSLEKPGVLRDKITKSIDEALKLSHSHGIGKLEFGQVVIFFLLTVITNLMDSVLEDLGIKLVSTAKPVNLYANEPYRDLEIDSKRNMNDRMQEHREQLCKTNTLMALEVVEKIAADKKNKVFFRLIHLNMPKEFNNLLERLQLLEVHQSTSHSLKSINHIIVRLISNIREVVNGESKLNRHQLLGILIDSEFCGPTSYYRLGADRSVCWISFDLLMENSMDGKHLHAISVVEILTDMTKTLQAVNQASWQETFMALWFSALRLVQRDREPWEGPIPHLDARLCMLLSIVPLVIVSIMKEELDTVSAISNYEQSTAINKSTSRRHGLVSSLQLLMQYTGLLSPPPSVANAANNAAAKAAKFIAHFKSGSSGIGANQQGAYLKAVGNMLHLIVEACIARKLIDTSAYFWPGYVVQSTVVKNSMLTEESPWSTFMEGTQLTVSLRNALMKTPASSVAELEKLYYTAMNGSVEEKSAAAKILCGASLIRGWNIQEHAVHMVVRLLSTPIATEASGPETCSHVISHLPMLSAILFGACSVEAIHIISLYGLVAEVAAALMPLCEVLGSFPPLPNHRPSPYDDTSIYSVFSCAFLFLLRLWKFYKPPQEHRIAGRGGTVRLEVTLDYLLLLHNHRIAVQNSSAKDKNDSSAISPVQPVYIDSFPKLRTWYLQNQACIASTLSVLCSKNPVHLVANKILNMMYCKMNKVGNISGNPSSTSSSSVSESPVSTAEDAYQRPLLPAWDILEAVPFVLEAVLTACANGRLSSRDLITGLRDLADFLPASLATIVSYFSAEITRGIWEPAAMNGIDWPSPATNLQLVESEIREILAFVGVTLPKCLGSTVPMLPLPMAALVSLTITFKLDKGLEYIHAVIGQALENCSAGSPWPSMHIVGALWAQKVRRWHDFIVLTATRSPFTRDKEAVAQLIRSCFSSFLGSGGSHCGASGLLGLSISNQGRRLPLAPGFLYLRSCRSFHDTHFVNNVILKLVIDWTRELVANQPSSEPSARLLSGKSSIAAATSAVRNVATLGTSLLCVAGGPLLVQVLYEETLPSALLSWEFSLPNGPAAATMRLLEGYAMAYMLVLSGGFIWGLRKTFSSCSSFFSSRHSRALGMHMEFVAGVLEGKVSVGCDPVTWKAYVSCLVGLLVRFVPSWIPEIRKGTLRKIAAGLKGWNEWELALALLERAGPGSVELVMESIL